MKTVRRVLVAAAAALGAYRVWRWMSRWGASEAELAGSFPGDELVAAPADSATMAVTVRAEPERVWSYLVQLGQDRGGMYSYEWLERAFGIDITNSSGLEDRWQHLEVGNRIQLAPPGWGPLSGGYALTVSRVDPPNILVLRQQPPEHPWDGIWTFTIEEIGPGLCRLVSHHRTHRPEGVAGCIGTVAGQAVGTPITWLMIRKMLLTIKRLAEG